MLYKKDLAVAEELGSEEMVRVVGGVHHRHRSPVCDDLATNVASNGGVTTGADGVANATCFAANHHPGFPLVCDDDDDC